MELVNGEPLNAVLARVGRLAVPHALDMLEQTGRALQVAHDAGVVAPRREAGAISSSRLLAR